MREAPGNFEFNIEYVIQPDITTPVVNLRPGREKKVAINHATIHLIAAMLM
jgi:hypothetical protein